MPGESGLLMRPPSFGEDERWSCSQTSSQWGGAIGFVVFGFAAVMCFLKGDPADGVRTPCFFAIFSIASVYLSLYSGTISMDHRGITKVCPLGTFFIDWRAITGIWTGGGQIVFAGSGRRLTMPGFKYWSGKGKAPMLSHLDTFCICNGIRPEERFTAIVMISRGTRQTAGSELRGA